MWYGFKILESYVKFIKSRACKVSWQSAGSFASYSIENEGLMEVRGTWWGGGGEDLIKQKRSRR